MGEGGCGSCWGEVPRVGVESSDCLIVESRLFTLNGDKSKTASPNIDLTKIC